MTLTTRTLLASASLALAMPSLAAAQGVNTDEAIAAEETAPVIQAEIIPLDQWGADWGGDAGGDDIRTAGFSIENILDADIEGPDGDDIGEVENVLFDADGRILSVIAETDGFLDIGDTHVNIPWEIVSAEDWTDGITVPFTEDDIGEYSLFRNEVVSVEQASSEVQEVSGDGPGEVRTGAEVWRATDLIGDYARLNRDAEPINYGYVEDIIVRDDRIAAVLVTADSAWTGARGTFAYPYYGTGYGWMPGATSYDLPYSEEEVGTLEPYRGPAVDEDAFDD